MIGSNLAAPHNSLRFLTILGAPKPLNALNDSVNKVLRKHVAHMLRKPDVWVRSVAISDTLDKPRRKNSALRGGKSAGRAAVREQVRVIDSELNELWSLGRNIVVGWSPADAGMNVLAIPQYALPELTDHYAELLTGSHMMSATKMDELARLLGARPVFFALPFSIGPRSVPARAVDSVVRRYSVTKSDHRAAILFDIVGFSLHSPLEQVTLLNSLSYSINLAHSRGQANGLNIDLGRTTTGDGFYVWNRDEGVDADLALFYLLMLTLADNAIARSRGAPRTAPVLRTCFHVGSHYEYYQAEGLNPGVSGFIVGDLTIELARMVNKTLPGQLLIGNFQRPTDDARGLISSPNFVDRSQARLDLLKNIVMAGENISSIKCYLTGEPVGNGVYTVKKYSIADKHGMRRDVFNAKMNIYRGNAEALYLGLGERDLERFDAEGGDYLPAEDAPKLLEAAL